MADVSSTPPAYIIGLDLQPDVNPYAAMQQVLINRVQALSQPDERMADVTLHDRCIHASRSTTKCESESFSPFFASQFGPVPLLAPANYLNVFYARLTVSFWLEQHLDHFRNLFGDNNSQSEGGGTTYLDRPTNRETSRFAPRSVSSRCCDRWLTLTAGKYIALNQFILYPISTILLSISQSSAIAASLRTLIFQSAVWIAYVCTLRRIWYLKQTPVTVYLWGAIIWIPFYWYARFVFCFQAKIDVAS